MICARRDIGFRVISECGNCKVYRGGQTYKLSDLIPKGHCLTLLHSLLPYMVTFEHGGWFKWMRDKDRVIVSCPSIENNVCVELKKISGGFTYNVLKIRGKCEFCKEGASYDIDKMDFSRMCWGLFNVIFPYLRTEGRGMSITCGRGRENGRFELIGLY